MKVDKDELEFHRLINILADQCEYKLTEQTLEIYDQCLKPHGYIATNEAIKQIFKTRRGRDKFPSVGDILDTMGLTVSPRALAVDAANTIFWSFVHWKMDFCHREDFAEIYQERIGVLPWITIDRMGGYRSLYKEWNESKDHSIFRAHLRDAALSLIEIESKTNQQLIGSGKILIKGGSSEP